jgi:hypothetical protein
MIDQEGFRKSIMKILNSSTLRPDQVARALLMNYFKESQGLRNANEVTIADLENFVNEFSWHLNQDDIRDFLWEVRFLLDDSGKLQVREVAGMIRDDVESFPK